MRAPPPSLLSGRSMKSYVIPCSSGFRDTVRELAARRGLTATDLASGVLALLDRETIDRIADPGEPAPDDRECVQLKSGPRKGRSLTRKPRLQLRLPNRLDHAHVRRALALAIELDAGRQTLKIVSPTEESRLAAEIAEQRQSLRKAEQDLADMRATLNVIAFDADGQAVSTTEQASYILGLPPGATISRELVKSRFRQLSRVFHPDLPTGDTARMSRIIEAVRYLEERLPRPFEFKPVI